jgi:hypothetical protein
MDASKFDTNIASAIAARSRILVSRESDRGVQFAMYLLDHRDLRLIESTLGQL